MAGNPVDLEAIFFAARHKAAPDRAAYLDQVCGDDAEVRQRVEQFLSAQAEIGSFLEAPAAQGPITTVEEPIRESLLRVCSLMGWAVGHAYVLDRANAKEMSHRDLLRRRYSTAGGRH